MELNYLLNTTLFTSTVQYKPVEHDTRMYQSYAVHSEIKPDFTFKATNIERKEVEKQAPVVY